ncbi:MAG: hypothetical protein J5923_01355 [Acidaminococcaceae bacterium]|nr:hypothetical protein [Acidaminococcaceae bacterium]MBR1662687.1 hypothetical protein [Acidaminococcaceae bacterium]
MARKWLEGAAVLHQETLTQPFTKRTDKRADELISDSLQMRSGGKQNENWKMG